MNAGMKPVLRRRLARLLSQVSDWLGCQLISNLPLAHFLRLCQLAVGLAAEGGGAGLAGPTALGRRQHAAVDGLSPVVFSRQA